MFSFRSFLIKLIVIKVCWASSGNNNICDQHGVLFYEDIGCKPIKNDGENCPNRFDCNFPQTKNGCTFKGKSYQVGQGIESDLTYSACSIGCNCYEANKFLCAVLDCPEFLHYNIKPDEDCYHGYTLGKCCSTGKICNTTSKTCQIDGESYKIGQKFYPKNTCLSCVCHEEFTGKFDEKTCRKQNCNAQIHYTEEINKNCAPAYFKTKSDKVLCCPDDFVCPEPKDDIKVLNDQVQPQIGNTQCTYGEKKLKLGEGFSRKVNKYGQDRNLNCECIMPPLVTCKEI